MRVVANLLSFSVVLCTSCTRAEVSRTAIPEQAKLTVSSTAPSDSSGPLPMRSAPQATSDTTVDMSLPLNTLRDSLSVEGNPEPQLPMVFADVCPGETCSYGPWIACKAITVRSEPLTIAPVAFTLNPGDTLLALTGNLIVEQAGKIVFRDTVHVQAYMDRYVFTPADTLYPLTYEGDSAGDWFIHGRVKSGFWFFLEQEGPQFDPRIVIVRKRITDWWVKARNRAGKEGWFKFESMIAGNPSMKPEDSCLDRR